MEVATTQNSSWLNESIDIMRGRGHRDPGTNAKSIIAACRTQDTAEQTSSINQWLTSLSIFREGAVPESW